MWICRLTPIKKGHVRRKMMLFNGWIWRLWARCERSKSSGQEKSSEIWSSSGDWWIFGWIPHIPIDKALERLRLRRQKLWRSLWVHPSWDLTCWVAPQWVEMPSSPAASCESPSSFQSLLAKNLPSFWIVLKDIESPLLFKILWNTVYIHIHPLFPSY